MGTPGGTVERGAPAPTATHVTSSDGTEITYWTSGNGPPLVLVHGLPADHTRWRPLLPHLEPRVTIHAMDRRGRGASGDGTEYDLAREFEDVAAVVDAVAASAGGPVDLYGHSFGGLCAFGAATLTANVRKLVLFEGWPLTNPDAIALPPEVGERLDALLAEGKRDAVVEAVFRDIGRMGDEEIAALRALASWQARVSVAHTIPRELRAAAEAFFDPNEAARITVAVLLVTGGDSDDPSKADIETVAAAMPDARILVLEGQPHVADVLAPEVFAPRLLAFLHGES